MTLEIWLLHLCRRYLQISSIYLPSSQRIPCPSFEMIPECQDICMRRILQILSGKKKSLYFSLEMPQYFFCPYSTLLFKHENTSGNKEMPGLCHNKTLSKCQLWFLKSCASSRPPDAAMENPNTTGVTQTSWISQNEHCRILFLPLSMNYQQNRSRISSEGSLWVLEFLTWEPQNNQITHFFGPAASSTQAPPGL